jgi:hypothetical protein
MNSMFLRLSCASFLILLTAGCDPFSGSFFKIGGVERSMMMPIGRIEIGGVAREDVLNEAVVRDFLATELGLPPDELGIEDFTDLNAVFDAVVARGVPEETFLDLLKSTVLENVALHLAVAPPTEGEFSMDFDISAMNERTIDPNDVEGSILALLYETPVIITARRAAESIGDLVGDTVNIDGLVETFGVASIVVTELGIRSLTPAEVALDDADLVGRLTDEGTFEGCAEDQAALTFFERLSIELSPMDESSPAFAAVPLTSYEIEEGSSSACSIVDSTPEPMNVALALAPGSGGLEFEIVIAGELLEAPTTLAGYFRFDAAVEDIDETDFGVSL